MNHCAPLPPAIPRERGMEQDCEAALGASLRTIVPFRNTLHVSGHTGNPSGWSHEPRWISPPGLGTGFALPRDKPGQRAQPPTAFVTPTLGLSRKVQRFLPCALCTVRRTASNLVAGHRFHERGGENSLESLGRSRPTTLDPHSSANQGDSRSVTWKQTMERPLMKQPKEDLCEREFHAFRRAHDSGVRQPRSRSCRGSTCNANLYAGPRWSTTCSAGARDPWDDVDKAQYNEITDSGTPFLSRSS